MTSPSPAGSLSLLESPPHGATAPATTTITVASGTDVTASPPAMAETKDSSLSPPAPTTPLEEGGEKELSPPATEACNSHHQCSIQLLDAFEEVRKDGAPDSLVQKLQDQLKPIVEFLEFKEGEVVQASTLLKDELKKSKDENTRLKGTVTTLTKEVEDLALKMNRQVEGMPSPLRLAVTASGLSNALKCTRESRTNLPPMTEAHLRAIEFMADAFQKTAQCCTDSFELAQSVQVRASSQMPPPSPTPPPSRSFTFRSLLGGSESASKHVTFAPSPSLVTKGSARKRQLDSSSPSPNVWNSSKRGRPDEEVTSYSASLHTASPSAPPPPPTTTNLVRLQQQQWKQLGAAATI